MKVNRIILVFLVIMMVFIPSVFAGYQEMNNLEYQVTLNEDGSADVKEIWNVYISDTNTIYKTFDMDYEKLSGITDVKVQEITNNNIKRFTQTAQWAYHLQKDTYCGVINPDGQFEIAWGVALDDDNDTRKYEISYTIKDVVKTYNDCSEFYWMFLANTNSIYCKNIIGTIRLPQKVDDIENLKVWAHGPLNGNIYRASEDTAKFEVSYLPENTMLEARIIVLDNTIFVGNPNKINEDKYQQITEEEQKWADEANRQREECIFFIEVIIGIGVLLCLILVYNIYRRLSKSKELIEKSDLQGLDYYREIPDEKLTPADVKFLLNTEIGLDFSNIFSATILHLITKKMIDFEEIIDEKNKKEVKFRILSTKYTNEVLKKSEKLVYDFLIGVNEEKEFTVTELKKYIEKKNKQIYDLKEEMEDVAKEEENAIGHYITNIRGKDVMALNVAFGFLTIIPSIIALMLGRNWSIPDIMTTILGIELFVIVILNIVNFVIIDKLKVMYAGITAKGMQEKEKWEALKKYLEEFSLLNERKIPEVTLWEKFLVFATVFGIAEKVIKTLKIKYPNMLNDSNVGLYSITNMYLIIDINRSVTSAVNARAAQISANNMSSGRGSGRRILWRWRLSEVEVAPWGEDNIINVK